MMFVYLCFFLFLIFCLADQVVNSPIIDQVSYIENPSSTVNTPGKEKSAPNYKLSVS